MCLTYSSECALRIFFAAINPLQFFSMNTRYMNTLYMEAQKFAFIVSYCATTWVDKKFLTELI